MEFKKQVMVTMSAAELSELLNIIYKLCEEDYEEGFVTNAVELYYKLTKELTTADAGK